MKNQYITWDDYYFRIDELVNKLKSKKDIKKYEFIVTPEVDDIFIGAYVSNRLDIPIALSIYEYNTTYRSRFCSKPKVLITSNVCGPDVIYSSIVNQLNDDFDSIIIFKDKDSEFEPTYYQEIPELYIYFPWQKSEYLKAFESKC